MKHYLDDVIKQIASAIAAAVVQELQISITQMAKVDLQPGDCLLFRMKGHPSKDAYVRIRESLEERFPDQRIVILTGDSDLQVMRNVRREKSSARG